MNPNLTAALGILLTAAVLIATYFFVRLAQQLNRLAAEVELVVKNLNAMKPQMERVLSSAEDELVQLRHLTTRIEHVATNVEKVSDFAVKSVVPAVEYVKALSGPLRYLRAGAAGASAGLAALRRFRRAQTS